MHRREETGHLPERAELENGVIQRRLPLEQDAPELQHHAETEGERHRDRTHVAGDGLVGVDDDLGFAAAQTRDFLRLLEPIGWPDPRQGLRRRNQAEPDQLTLEAPDECHPAALE